MQGDREFSAIFRWQDGCAQRTPADLAAGLAFSGCLGEAACAPAHASLSHFSRTCGHGRVQY